MIGSKPVRPRRPDSNQTAFGKTGAVQYRGREVDGMQVLGCAAGYNLRWLLRWIAFLRAWMGATVWMSLRAVQRSTQAVGD
ncbi:hypothetical protein ACQR5S_12810 [Xanthomonas oryzae pv. oryzicola]|uniref:hypothetical protein n=1 Tax=Xanthomonas oryzae TaxID=347 RepID=UPI003D16C083